MAPRRVLTNDPSGISQRIAPRSDRGDYGFLCTVLFSLGTVLGAEQRPEIFSYKGQHLHRLLKSLNKVLAWNSASMSVILGHEGNQVLLNYLFKYVSDAKACSYQSKGAAFAGPKAELAVNMIAQVQYKITKENYTNMDLDNVGKKTLGRVSCSQT